MNTQQVSKSFLLTLLVVGIGLSTSVFAQPWDDDGGGGLEPGIPTTITRDVDCRDQYGNIVADSFCDPNIQPTDTSTTMCPVTPVGPTNTYSWVGTWWICVENLSCQALNSSSISNVETCNALTVANCASQPVCMAQSNGLGTQTMSYVCQDQNGNPANWCGDTYPEGSEVATQTCNTYHRSATDWGPCNNNTQTRTVTCLDASNNIVPDSYCNQPKPTETQTGYCSNNTWTNLYFWFKEEGQCDQGEIWAVCEGNGYTNERVKRDGTLYERQDSESIIIQNPNDAQTCYEYLIYQNVWRVMVIDCGGNGGWDLYTRNTLRDGCSIYPGDQSCDVTATENLSQIYQWAECRAKQVQSARRDTFVCKELSGDLSTTVADSFCTYAPKPADIILSCDLDGPGNPNYWWDQQGGYGGDCDQQGWWVTVNWVDCWGQDQEQDDQEDNQGDQWGQWDDDQWQEQDGYDP
jgi:hypothetical protein